jgi:hypothetical protein
MDPTSGRLVMEGATYGSDLSIKEGTYFFNGSDWEVHDGLCPPAGESSCTYGAGMATDPKSKRIILEGGSLQAPSRTTAVFDGTAWHVVIPAHRPTPGYAGGAPDPDHGTVVVYTNDGNTWTWTGGDWQQHAGGPTGGGSLAYDPDHHAVLMFGGGLPSVGVDSSQMWSWDGSAWQLIPST